MALTAIYAHLSCSDLARGVDWFSAVFRRGPDARPMAGLAEWHHGTASGFHLYENAEHAGHGTLTLIVDAVRGERARLSQAGLEPGEVQEADYAAIVQLRDPDRNLVVLAQPIGP